MLDEDVIIEPKVLEQARKAGLFGNVERRLRKMVFLAAPASFPEGNRRYEGFLFRIEKGVLKEIHTIDPLTEQVQKPVLERLEKRRKTLKLVEKHFGKNED